MPPRREPNTQKVLLTFVGFHDPFRTGPSTLARTGEGTEA